MDRLRTSKQLLAACGIGEFSFKPNLMYCFERSVALFSRSFLILEVGRGNGQVDKIINGQGRRTCEFEIKIKQ